MSFSSFAANPANTNATSNSSHGDLLQFLDGSALHGQLKKVDTSSGVRWQYPDAKAPVDFRSTNIDHILFAQSKTLSIEPTCHFRFVNGDELFARLSSLDDDSIGVVPWFGSEIKVPRNTLQTITFLSRKFSILYEGPTDDSGWRYANNPQDAANRNHPGANPSNWFFRDGEFICTGAGFLGRDFGLTNSSTIEFDLACNGQFQMLISIYTDALDHLDYGVSSYMLNLTPDQVALQRVQSGAGPNNFAGVPVPNPEKRNNRHVEIRANKEESTITVLVDHTLVKRWQDNNGFVARGSGVLFYVLSGGPIIKLSNMKVSEWDGKFEPEGVDAPPSGTEVVNLINHDKAAGALRSLQNGKLKMVVGDKPLDIPIDRITQINFPAKNAKLTRLPWEVRAHFPGGGRLSFQLDQWDDKKLSGHSATFGALAFQADSIREIEFNLDRPREAVPTEDEFGGFDE